MFDIRGSVVVFLFSCCFSFSTLGWSAAPGFSKAKKVTSWSISGTFHSARWSANGKYVLVSSFQGQNAALTMVSVATKKQTVWHRSKYGFFPCFGPVGTIFSGPKSDPLPISKTLLKKKNRKKLAHKGVFLLGRKIRSFLYPGWKPRYSLRARRLVFQYRGLLYLWNPLPKKRKKSLLLLTKGDAPRWAPNGRAIAFLRRPFLVDAKGKTTGGGIRIIDMLFRGAKVTKTGGQVTWSPDSRSIVYVDQWSKGSIGLFKVLLKGKKTTSLPLVKGGFAPAWAPDTQHTKGLLAYQDLRGVWVVHLKTRKKHLIAPHASFAAWSSNGQLLVVKGKVLTILQIAPDLVHLLSK